MFQTRQNNFDFLRLIGAMVVVFNHSFSICGFKVDDFLYQLTGNIATGTFVLSMFFVISGYLICGSYFNRNGFSAFFSARVLRIIPALAVALLVTVFVVAPLVTSLSLKDFFSSPLTWRYFICISLFKLQFVLPGVFADGFHHTHSINGSIWSLSYEFTMYILLFVFAKIGLLKKNVFNYIFHSIIIVAMIFLNQHTELTDFKFVGIEAEKFVNLYVYFFMGAWLFLLKDKIKPIRILLIAFSVLWIVSFDSIYFSAVSFFFIPLFIIFIAQIQVPLFQKITSFGDFSYGIYIYGFLVQQCIIHFAKGNISVWQMVGVSIPITLLLAIASWFVIEKRALGWKRFFNQ